MKKLTLAACLALTAQLAFAGSYSNGMIDNTARANAATAQATADSASSVAATLTTPVNNSAASSDISLSVGQSAYVDDTASAVTAIPLHIATADNQLYHVVLNCTGLASASSAAGLLPNNTALTNYFYSVRGVWTLSGIASGGGYASGFEITENAAPNFVVMDITTATAEKHLIATFTGYNSTSGQTGGVINGFWDSAASSGSSLDSTTPWASLGTINLPTAEACRATVTRTQ